MQKGLNGEKIGYEAYDIAAICQKIAETLRIVPPSVVRNKIENPHKNIIPQRR